MTDFQIFEDKYQVPLSLIILKMGGGIEKRKGGELHISMMDEASDIETNFF